MSDRDYPKDQQSALSAQSNDTLDIDELQMRETLGLNARSRPQLRAQASTAPKQRHRFVQDGEVQVIHLAGHRDGDATATLRGRIASLEAELEAEQAARVKAEHVAQAAQAQCHALETKLAHVELATRETLANERQAREAAQSELRLAIAERDAAREAITARGPDSAALVPAQPRAKRMPKVKAAPRTKEPKPVKWWLGKTKT